MERTFEKWAKEGLPEFIFTVELFKVIIQIKKPGFLYGGGGYLFVGRSGYG